MSHDPQHLADAQELVELLKLESEAWRMALMLPGSSTPEYAAFVTKAFEGYGAAVANVYATCLTRDELTAWLDYSKSTEARAIAEKCDVIRAAVEGYVAQASQKALAELGQA